MSKHDNNTQQPAPVQGVDYFHGAALVTADGREIPITETMVQQALAIVAQQDSAAGHTYPAHRVR